MYTCARVYGFRNSRRPKVRRANQIGKSCGDEPSARTDFIDEYIPSALFPMPWNNRRRSFRGACVRSSAIRSADQRNQRNNRKTRRIRRRFATGTERAYKFPRALPGPYGKCSPRYVNLKRKRPIVPKPKRTVAWNIKNKKTDEPSTPLRDVVTTALLL